LDVRGWTITTAIAREVHEQLADLEVGDEIELEAD
jgi:phosphoribosylformylglycinamidine (FGAM) synthase PurS component